MLILLGLAELAPAIGPGGCRSSCSAATRTPTPSPGTRPPSPPTWIRPSHPRPFPAPSVLTAHQRLRIEAIAPPRRVHGKNTLHQPGVVGLLGIEFQEIRLLALSLDDVTWPPTPIS